MTNGSQAIRAAGGVAALSEPPVACEDGSAPDNTVVVGRNRLRKHADYQRVYKASRKHFSLSMSFFFCRRAEAQGEAAFTAARVGLTAGKVLGKAVERNRIKRRMREAVRMNVSRLPQSVDVVLHPRKAVIDMEFAKLTAEVARIFATVSEHLDKGSDPAKAAGLSAAGRKARERSARAGAPQ